MSRENLKAAHNAKGMTQHKERYMENKPTTGLNATGKVAVFTALKKLADEGLKKARNEADTEAYQLFESFGSDRMKIMLGGVEVGTLSLRFPSDDYEVDNAEAFNEFCLLNGLAHTKKSIKPEYMVEVIARIEDDMPQAIDEETVLEKDAKSFFKPLGDVMFLEGTDTIVPGIKPASKTPSGTMVRGCDPKVVLPAIQGLPGGVEQLLLGGPNE